MECVCFGSCFKCKLPPSSGAFHLVSDAQCICSSVNRAAASFTAHVFSRSCPTPRVCIRLRCSDKRRVCPAAYQWDYVFDWTVLKYQQSQATRRVHREPGGMPGQEAEDEEAALVKR